MFDLKKLKPSAYTALILLAWIFSGYGAMILIFFGEYVKDYDSLKFSVLIIGILSITIPFTIYATLVEFNIKYSDQTIFKALGIDRIELTPEEKKETSLNNYIFTVALLRCLIPMLATFYSILLRYKIYGPSIKQAIKVQLTASVVSTLAFIAVAMIETNWRKKRSQSSESPSDSPNDTPPQPPSHTPA